MYTCGVACTSEANIRTGGASHLPYDTVVFSVPEMPSGADGLSVCGCFDVLLHASAQRLLPLRGRPLCALLVILLGAQGVAYPA